VKQVGREVRVCAMCSEGSLRKAGNRIRRNRAACRGRNRQACLAERYDRDLPDIFAVQDEITEAVTIAIAPAIAEAEQRRAMRKPPGSLDRLSTRVSVAFGANEDATDYRSSSVYSRDLRDRSIVP